MKGDSPIKLVGGRKFSKAARERAQTVVESKVDFEKRRIYLHDEIDTDLATDIIVNVDIMDELPGEITVKLFSVGGEVAAGFAIYDALRLTKNKVVVVGSGEVSSMAAIILQGGDKRLLTPEVRVMIHNVYVEMGGQPQRMDSAYFMTYAQEIKTLSSRYHSVLAEHTKVPLRRIRDMCRRETYLGADEAVALNFADDVIRPTKSSR